MAEDQKQENSGGVLTFFREAESFFRGLTKERNRELPKKVDLSPNLDPLLVRAIGNVKKGYEPFYVKNPRPIKPNDHYLEIMRLKGWLDLDLNDPDLAPLFK